MARFARTSLMLSLLCLSEGVLVENKKHIRRSSSSTNQHGLLSVGTDMKDEDELYWLRFLYDTQDSSPPVAAPTTPPVQVPTAPPLTAPMAAPTAPPVAAPTVPPVAGPTTPPVAAPTVPPVAGPTTPPMAAPTTVPPVAAPTVPPVAGPTTPPVAAPTVPPVAGPTTPPMAAPTTVPPVAGPTTPPMAAPTTPPAAAPTVPPVVGPTTPPVAAPTVPPRPTTPPMAAPTVPPVAGPTTPPMAAPTSPPLTAPSAPPVAAPTNSPVAAPTSPPAPTPETPFVCTCPESPNTVPQNDDCDQAQPLAINGQLVIGDTNNATDSTRADDVVYQFTGNGRRVRISTCFDETTTAHNFVLRNGGCTSLVLGESSADFTCPENVNAAAYEFETVLGRTYPIFVYPRGEGQQGQFAIQITDYPNPSNDNCPQAIPLSINGVVTIGDTINATDSTRADDVVYQFTGNGRRVRISTCFDETTTAHNFVLRNGGCTSLVLGESSADSTCPENVNAAAYEFETVLGRTYPIFVYPRGEGQQGQFAIQITDYPNPSNDNCPQAIPLSINGVVTIGDTINATDSTRADDVVYQFTGNGRRVRISTCFDETTTAHNFVLRNGGCTSLVLGESSADFTCPENVNAAAYEFDTVLGRTYPIFVYPRGEGQQGQFAIQITDYPNPSNDNCPQAILLEIGGTAITGTTENATDSTRADDVVYQFTGNGRRVRISTCFDETTTAHNFVLRNGGCTSLVLGESSADFTCPENVNAAAYEFDTVLGRTYPIFVYPRLINQGGPFAMSVTDAGSRRLETGAFDVDTAYPADEVRSNQVIPRQLGLGETSETYAKISSLSPGQVDKIENAVTSINYMQRLLIASEPRSPCVCPESDSETPYNDNCPRAQSLSIGGTPLVGSTTTATDSTRPSDVVYQFTGNGRRVRISTCFDETTTAHNFVLRNGGCTSLVLGESSADSTCPENVNAAAYEFETVLGRMYPIFVYPRGEGQQGQFAIQITDYPNPSNDNCPQAIPLSINGVVTIGDTINATDSTRADDVVYQFTGNGRRVRISTCFDETTTAHNFVLRNGGCTSLVLGESSADSTCPENVNAAAYEFETVLGRTYPIFVYPRGEGQQGQFAIQITDYPNPSNDNCPQAIPLSINGVVTIGDTINATDSTRADDVVYQFTGNGRRVRISTCFDETTTAHNFVLRNGGCTSLVLGESSADSTCPENVNAAAYEFDTVLGRTYPIFVYPRGEGQQGQFAIQITDYPNPSNDNCPQAIPLSINGVVTIGDTINATDSTRADDVVYQFTGNGGRVRISTCFDETTTAHNFVLRNGGCTSLVLGESSADFTCPENVNAAAYEFETVLGRTYPIFVYPRGEGQQGQFAIQLNEVQPP